MSKQIEAMKLAREALNRTEEYRKGYAFAVNAAKALDEALAEQPAQQEPVAAECKFDREQRWVRCEIAHHNLVQSEPHNWAGYQTRLLYATPQAQP